jgi:hypothetical protein
MTSAQNATEAAVYAALSADGVLSWPIYQHVPEDTPPPVNIIGDMTGEPLEDKGGGDERIELTIDTVYQGEARKPVLDEQDKISAALDEKTLTVTGWTIRPVKLSADALLLPDGETYLGTTRFTVFALAD